MTDQGIGDETVRVEAVYVISVAAERAGLHPQTLRVYERKGLLEPSRTDGNTRRYSERDIERAQLIQRLTTEQGLNLAGVRMVIEVSEALRDSQTRIRQLEDMVKRLASQIDQDVAEAHASHKFELARRPAGEVSPHPDFPRRTSRR